MYLFEGLKLDPDGRYTTMDKNRLLVPLCNEIAPLFHKEAFCKLLQRISIQTTTSYCVTSYSHATCASGTECEMASVVFSSVWLILGCVSVRRKRESYRVVDVQREVKRYSSCCLRACWWGGLPVD